MYSLKMFDSLISFGNNYYIFVIYFRTEEFVYEIVV